MFTIRYVKLKQQNIKLPSLISGGSLIFMIATVLLTDPTKSVGWAILFFALLFALIVSFAITTARLQGIVINPKIRHRILVLASLIVVGLMLRSAGSLSMMDFLVLILIFSGSIFYFGHRD